MSAAGAAAADARAIAAGTASRTLMQRAGAAAAAEIAEHCAARLDAGVAIATGAGNNGGDGWVVARALHAVGIAVRVVECAEARTPDAAAERALALAEGVRMERGASALATGSERVLVDAIVGTGFRADSPLRDAAADGVAALLARANDATTLVALDVPSGLDATSGRNDAGLRADLTLTFGTVKQGQLVAREACGELRVLDIGLGAHARAADDLLLATPAWFRAALPAIAAGAHKGTRARVAVVGGAAGMAGAAMLAARGALRSGAGLVQCIVAEASVAPIQEGEPAAIVAPWPRDDDDARLLADRADAMLLGPGLGTGDESRALLTRLLRAYAGPVVLDADALNLIARDLGQLGEMRELLGARPALLTPHPAELARLVGSTVEEVLDARFTLPRDVAQRTGAAVLLKGVPTVIAAPDGSAMAVAEGTPILATGGAGDVLGGIAATLLAQTKDALRAGALAAFAHGRAASLVSARQVRGYTLDDVLACLPAVWSLQPPAPRPPLLVTLPAVGERAG